MSDAPNEAARWLVVLRHAKSAWPDRPDAERPLSKRGLRDAPMVGAWLRDHRHRPDQVICSTARRARATWELAANRLAAAPPVRHDPRIYAADADTLLSVLAECPDQATTVLLVGHLPSVRDLTLRLAGEGSHTEPLERVRTKFPTSGIAVLAIPTRWADLAAKIGRLTDFAVPRG